jgi:hypothetical protein
MMSSSVVVAAAPRSRGAVRASAAVRAGPAPKLVRMRAHAAAAAAPDAHRWLAIAGHGRLGADGRRIGVAGAARRGASPGARRARRGDQGRRYSGRDLGALRLQGAWLPARGASCARSARRGRGHHSDAPCG